MNRSYSNYLMMSLSVAAMLIIMGAAFAAGLILAPSVNSDVLAAESTGEIKAVAAPAQQGSLDSDDVLAAYEQAFTGLYRDALPSIVSIRVQREISREGLSRFFEFPNPDEDEDAPDSTPEEGEEPEIPEDFFFGGGGSGFVWDTEGHIITNHHVVADANDIEVIFADDTQVKAELVGSDPDADVAVIKVDLPAAALKPLAIGDSDALEVGQLVIALGNPFGQEFTMTTGIVSAVGRTIRSGNSQFSIPQVIQTDAAINPGNSGGPLLNRAGEVIGINTQIVSQSGVNSGVGFAVPSDIVQRVVLTLISGDEYEYPWLGISGNTLTVEAAEFRKLDTDTRGAVVFEVTTGGPAEQAGLEGVDTSFDEDSDAFRYSGDIITAINGQAVHDMSDLITYLVGETAPGDVVTLDVIRNDGTQEQVEVTLGVRPDLSAASEIE
ncbi:MAG TPA: trypsin-like peptidase domain-containing protein [Anaerolineae bacterium]|nr:trypsin-like peptidase domain-containing protein [Anaerolineae bacterium]